MDFNDFDNNFDLDAQLDADNQYIDIYVKQRNARKCITTIEGLCNDKDILKSYAKDLRKKIACSCCVDCDNGNYFLKLSGKDVDAIKEYLINTLNIDEDKIRIHGIEN